MVKNETWSFFSSLAVSPRVADAMVLFTAQAQTSGIASPFYTQPPLAETSQKS